MKRIDAALIGAGARGAGSYGNYALKYPNEIRFIAVAEPDEAKRERFADLHHIAAELRFRSWEELLDRPRLCEALLICTQDRMHFMPTMAALELGYDILLEKPISPDPAECVQLGEVSERLGRILMICHVLRYTPFFAAIKTILDEGRIGRIISVQHNENVGYWHQAHSFVRGAWRNLQESSPMILAKSCHDMDILHYLIGTACVRVSSFGSLSHFTAKNAPAGATARCTDGCAVESVCPYSALRIYLTAPTSGWPVSVLGPGDLSPADRLRALEEGPYGRCVYHCDNDVVDHQVVNLEFENEVTAAFTMCGFTTKMSRTLKIMGTRGEIRGLMEDGRNLVEVSDFATGQRTVIQTDGAAEGHGGGDEGLMRAFVRQIRGTDHNQTVTSAKTSIHSHLMAFAAEESRLTGRVIRLDEYAERSVGKTRP